MPNDRKPDYFQLVSTERYDRVNENPQILALSSGRQVNLDDSVGRTLLEQTPEEQSVFAATAQNDSHMGGHVDGSVLQNTTAEEDSIFKHGESTILYNANDSTILHPRQGFTGGERHQTSSAFMLGRTYSKDRDLETIAKFKLYAPKV